MSRIITTRWLLLMPLFMLIFGSAWYVMAAPNKPYTIFSPPELRKGYDPLAAYEVEAAIVLMQNGNSTQKRTENKMETLLIERHQEEKAIYARGTWDRRADVYAYDYGTNEMHYTVVNLTTDSIDHFEKVQGVQLPLTQVEVARAATILLADDSGVGQQLYELYEDMFGQRLTIDDIDIAPFIYKAASRGITTGINASCGIDRCAELLIETTDNFLVPFSPIVNLSANKVVGIANQS